MQFEIITVYRSDLSSSLINSTDENRLNSLSSIVWYFANLVPTEFSSEFTNDGIITRSKEKCQITTNEKSNKITVETEYFAIAAKICSNLNSNNIDYEIKVNKQMQFKGTKFEKMMEANLKRDPSIKITGENFGLEKLDNREIADLSFCNLEFKFEKECFQNDSTDEDIIKKSFLACKVYYYKNGGVFSDYKFSKNDLTNIKLTQYGLETIQEWLAWHRDILNTPYLDLEDVLLENNLIMEVLYA